MSKPSITIFGVGRVGSTLEKALYRSGYPIHSTFTRGRFPKSLDELGELVFLTVHDKEIESLSSKIASLSQDFQDKTIIHCSGTLDSMVLRSLKEKGANTASFHPLKAVTLDQSSLEGVWFDMEGDSKAINVLKEIVVDLKAECFEIERESKTLLHAAAVVSANYLVTLMKLASDIAKAGDINEKIAFKALLPLAESSLQNIKEKGFKDSLTGPIARGDVNTILKHIDALRGHPELLSTYKELGLYTLQLLSSEEAEQRSVIEKIFEQE
jgi:predicted short-subunit dehydrogenase-like oxidoreductase (DUF2520 family)